MEEVEMRTCKICGDEKPLNTFPKTGKWYRHRCMSCWYERLKTYQKCDRRYNENDKKYAKSEKGKATQKRYLNSEQGKAKKNELSRTRTLKNSTLVLDPYVRAQLRKRFSSLSGIKIPTELIEAKRQQILTLREIKNERTGT